MLTTHLKYTKPHFIWTKSSSSNPLNPFTQDWIQRVENNGGSVSPERAILFDTWFTPVISIIQKLDYNDTGKGRILIYVAENDETARTNIVNDSFFVTPLNSPNFVPDSYYEFNGINQALDTNYNPVAISVPNTDNFSVMSWNDVNSSFAIKGLINNTTAQNSMYFYIVPTSFLSGKNLTAGGSEQSFNTITDVMVTGIKRNGSNFDGFDHDSLQVVVNPVVGVFSNKTYYDGALNGTTTPSDFTNGQMLFSIDGAFITNTEWQSLYNAIKGYCLSINPSLNLP